MDDSPRPSDMSISDVGNVTSGGALSKISSKRVKDQKTTRVRTVLNEKQLHTLRTCYNANPRPDALMKEQLVEMTSLSPRVIRVWFQNKRCKDKKKQILMKQMEQQQQKVRSNSRKRSFEIFKIQEQFLICVKTSRIIFRPTYIWCVAAKLAVDVYVKCEWTEIGNT